MSEPMDTPDQNQQREPELTDQQILDFEQKIKDEEAQKIPLVCQVDPIAKLREEFEGNTQAFQNKIMNLATNHDRIRRCRGDGNCFYRAFAFAWFESLLDSNPETFNRALATLKSTPDLLLNAGFQQLAIEDFYDVTLEQFEMLPQRRPYPDDLLATFQSDEVSNAIVMHLRFVTSAYLKTHAAEYEPFLLVEMVSIDEFCSNNVEAFGRESDQYQIIALTKALGVPVEVAYLDGTSGENVTFHEFWPDEADKARGVKPLKLIYRPGHYDILYERSYAIGGSARYQ